jgi:hypothetical protein
MSSTEGGWTGPRDASPEPVPPWLPPEDDGRPPKIFDEDEPPPPAQAGEALWFDGRRLNHVVKVATPGHAPGGAATVVGGCMIDRAWPAVSGRIGTTCSTLDQKKKNVGPIPESLTKYSVDPQTTQSWSDLDIKTKIKAYAGHGTFEWGPTAWGLLRTPS